MIRIAVVGDIGSGKSHVAKEFGYPVFNADVEVSKLYRKSKKCFNKLKKALPKHIVSFPIKKSQISKAIINSQRNLNCFLPGSSVMGFSFSCGFWLS